MEQDDVDDEEEELLLLFTEVAETAKLGEAKEKAPPDAPAAPPVLISNARPIGATAAK
jgi:hypothetical protein